LPVFCVLSTAAYVAFSELAAANLQTVSYLDFLLRNFPAGHDPLYILLFAATCLLTGALVSEQLREWCGRGPTFCLFTLAAVLVPPQIVALVRWPDGQGAIRSDVLLEIS
jgi:hypothetical protein